jgi:hypothetical protein
MAQAFSRSAVLIVKLALLGTVGAVVIVIIVVRWRMAPDDVVMAAVPQPIPFSHKHHVGDDGLDCRYCHTSVEKSRFAGLPSSDICLTCHSQLYRDAPMLAPLHESARTNTPIHWNRVHDLPDFAYFDHSIHVSKGVPCMTCHGRVDQMPLTTRIASLQMQWCLSCHRHAEQNVRPREDEFKMRDIKPPTKQESALLASQYHLHGTRRLTDCSTCHR